MKPSLTQAKKYLSESQPYIYGAITIFLIATAFGVIFADTVEPFVQEIIRELLGKTRGFNAQELVFFIMQNNLQSAFISIVLGLLVGIFPIFSATTNGIVLGYVATRAVEIEGFTTLWRLVPHGIFELPAIFIAFGLGIKLGFTIFIERKKRKKEFLRRVHESANTFLAIILPLIVIAAIIEGILIAFFP